MCSVNAKVNVVLKSFFLLFENSFLFSKFIVLINFNQILLHLFWILNMYTTIQRFGAGGHPDLINLIKLQ